MYVDYVACRVEVNGNIELISISYTLEDITVKLCTGFYNVH